MDKNQVIGIVLIFSIFFAWQQFVAPSPEELEAEQRRQDSIALVEQQRIEAEASKKMTQNNTAATVESVPDSVLLMQRAGTYGAFAAATIGEEKEVVIENDVMKITLSNKGGAIKQVELKNFSKVLEDSAHQQTKVPLVLLEDAKNKFEYNLPVPNTPNGIIRSSDLYFQPQLNGNSLTLTAALGEGRSIVQSYTLKDGAYLLDYNVSFNGLQQILKNDASYIQLNWENYLDKIELNDNYERNYSSIYYKPVDDNVDRCSCVSADEVDSDGQNVKWVAMTNQFFTSAIFAQNSFGTTDLRAEILDENSDDLKKVSATINIPYNHGADETMAMQLYVGPNEFERMQAIGHDFSDVIPYGRSVFGAINRWLIRPLFNFFDKLTGNKGVAILLLTLLVKLLVFPLTFKMLKSQSKMAAMKPYLEKVKAKHKDDQQAQQMETMKMYREYGVSPLGGCFPMLLQMPIWFALYRFFPAAITFRQESFLWATDLSSYDVLTYLPFEIPLGFGAHISLFAILWAVTTLIYTYYNTKHMDFGANPSMKYFQYIMPVMFLGFFNSFASGLTAYLFFSNLFNITQTVVTKNFVIDQEAIKAELEENKKKPKKKGGFQSRLEEALKEQQRKAAEMEKKKKK